VGKLMERAGLVLEAAVLVLTGAGVLVLTGAGVAHAQSASTSACQKIYSTEASFDTTLSTVSHPSHATLVKLVGTFGSQLTQAASTDSPAVKSAIATEVTDLEAGVAAGNLDVAKMTAESNAVIAACTPKGDPATGGGSTAGIQDPAMFGLGGVAVLASVVVLCLAWRNRLRAGPARPLG
jgi:hypothetical protein